MDATKFTLTFGHSDAGGDAIPANRIARARAYAIKAFCQACGGASSTTRLGAWVAPSGDTVLEECTEVTGWYQEGSNFNDVARATQMVARAVGVMLSQHSVMVTTEIGAVEFVEPR